MLSGFIPVKTDVKLISGRGQGKRWNDFWQAAACAYHSICQTEPREIHSSSSQQPSSSALRGMHLPSLETAAWAAACLFEMTHQDSDRSQDCSLKKKRLVMISFTKARSASVIISAPGASGWGWTSLALACLDPPVFITYVWIFLPHCVRVPLAFFFFPPRTQPLSRM